MQVVTDSLPTQNPKGSCSLFNQDRNLAAWLTWTCIHSEKHSLLSLLAT